MRTASPWGRRPACGEEAGSRTGAPASGQSRSSPALHRREPDAGGRTRSGRGPARSSPSDLALPTAAAGAGRACPSASSTGVRSARWSPSSRSPRTFVPHPEPTQAIGSFRCRRADRSPGSNPTEQGLVPCRASSTATDDGYRTASPRRYWAVSSSRRLLRSAGSPMDSAAIAGASCSGRLAPMIGAVMTGLAITQATHIVTRSRPASWASTSTAPPRGSQPA